MSDTPEHRTAVSARSGDTHVIGAEDNAVAVNVEQQARDAAAAEAAKPAKRAARTDTTTDESNPAA
jgi:hypothetical protein